MKTGKLEPYGDVDIKDISKFYKINTIDHDHGHMFGKITTITSNNGIELTPENPATSGSVNIGLSGLNGSNANKYLKANSDGTSIEWADDTGGGDGTMTGLTVEKGIVITSSGGSGTISTSDGIKLQNWPSDTTNTETMQIPYYIKHNDGNSDLSWILAPNAGIESESLLTHKRTTSSVDTVWRKIGSGIKFGVDTVELNYNDQQLKIVAGRLEINQAFFTAVFP